MRPDRKRLGRVIQDERERGAFFGSCDSEPMLNAGWHDDSRTAGAANKFSLLRFHAHLARDRLQRFGPRMMMNASFCAGSHDRLHISSDIFRAGIGKQRPNFRRVRSACRPITFLCNTQQPYFAERLYDGSPRTSCSLRRRFRWKAIDVPIKRCSW